MLEPSALRGAHDRDNGVAPARPCDCSGRALTDANEVGSGGAATAWLQRSGLGCRRCGPFDAWRSGIRQTAKRASLMRCLFKAPFGNPHSLGATTPTMVLAAPAGRGSSPGRGTAIAQPMRLLGSTREHEQSTAGTGQDAEMPNPQVASRRTGAGTVLGLAEFNGCRRSCLYDHEISKVR
jgi:hypothetical protein